MQFDCSVAENRKLVLRALDSKISQQDDGVALAAIELALKIINNIISHPSDPKYKKIRANNPAISQKLIRCPGGQVRAALCTKKSPHCARRVIVRAQHSLSARLPHLCRISF